MPNPVKSLITQSQVKSFADLKAVAVRTADNNDFQFEFPTAGPETKLPSLSLPIQPPDQGLPAAPAAISAWRHGGLND